MAHIFPLSSTDLGHKADQLSGICKSLSYLDRQKVPHPLNYKGLKTREMALLPLNCGYLMSTTALLFVPLIFSWLEIWSGYVVQAGLTFTVL